MTSPEPLHLPDQGSTSESEEMYLITVARAIEDGEVEPVPVAAIAKRLQVSVASANEMVRKLSTRDLMVYEPYHGVSLTSLGATVAERVLRTRRLWARFLADHLGLSPDEADDQACLLEHVTMPDAVERLAGFLGDPQTGPLGKPIPHRGTGDAGEAADGRLSDLPVGARAEVVSVDGSRQAASFLAGEGLTPGSSVAIEGAGDGGTLVRVGSRLVHVTADLARQVRVRTIG